MPGHRSLLDGSSAGNSSSWRCPQTRADEVGRLDLVVAAAVVVVVVVVSKVYDHSLAPLKRTESL